MPDIVRITRTELFKVVRRPAAWVLLATAVVLNLVFGYLIPYLGYVSGDTSFMEGVGRQEVLDSILPDQLVTNTIGAFGVFIGALALVFGALVAGSEHGWGTQKTLLTQGPGRVSMMLGQFLAMVVAALGAVVALFLFGAAATAAIAAAEGRAFDFPGPAALAEGAASGWLILVMWAVLGGFLATVLRSVALPIGLGVVWVLGLENLVSALATSTLSALEPLRDVLPGVNAGSLIGAVVPSRAADMPPGVNDVVGGGRALLTLGCYVAVCAAVAVWAHRRRDVA